VKNNDRIAPRGNQPTSATRRRPLTDLRQHFVSSLASQEYLAMTLGRPNLFSFVTTKRRDMSHDVPGKGGLLFGGALGMGKDSGVFWCSTSVDTRSRISWEVHVNHFFI
jgi:hypothetical protein